MTVVQSGVGTEIGGTSEDETRKFQRLTSVRRIFPRCDKFEVKFVAFIDFAFII